MRIKNSIGIRRVRRRKRGRRRVIQKGQNRSSHLSQPSKFRRKNGLNRPSSVHRTVNWLASAWRSGVQAAENIPWPEHDNERMRYLQTHWLHYYRGDGAAIPTQQYAPAMKAFIEGYCSISGKHPPNWVLLPTDKTVAAVVTAMNEEKSITAVLQQLERMPLHEIAVVINGSTDQSLEEARKSGKSVIVHYTNPLGHDVGRSIGAKLTSSDIVVFTDADFSIDAEQLISFIRVADQGMDVALNDLSRYIGAFTERDDVSVVKEFLNRSMKRPDLTVNSLTAVPHALTRNAINRIGWANLAVPPKAQAIALIKGLRAGIGGSVDVIKNNRLRTGNTGASNNVARLILGDHVEALEWMMKAQHPRLDFMDQSRNRNRIGGGT